MIDMTDIQYGDAISLTMKLKSAMTEALASEQQKVVNSIRRGVDPAEIRKQQANTNKLLDLIDDEMLIIKIAQQMIVAKEDE